MAAKAKSPMQPMYDSLAAWQRFRDITDQQMGDALSVGRTTWQRYKKGTGDIPHATLVRAVNFLRIPVEDATAIMMAGVRRF